MGTIKKETPIQDLNKNLYDKVKSSPKIAQSATFSFDVKNTATNHDNNTVPPKTKKVSSKTSSQKLDKGKPGRKKSDKKDQNGSKRKSAPATETVSSEKASPIKKKKRHNSTSQVDKDPNAVTGIKNTIESNDRTDYQIDPDDDSYNSVTCSCGKPFHGRLMVECESCEIWYLADCVGLTNETIPEKFICDKKVACSDFAKKQMSGTSEQKK